MTGRNCNLHVVFIALLVMILGSQAILVVARPDNPCTEGQPAGKIDTLKCPAGAGDWINWILPHAIGPILAFAIGVLAVPIIIFTCCYRYCCQCCGGSKLSPGAGCCPGSNNLSDNYEEEDIFDAYSKPFIIGLKVFVLILFILCIVALAVSFAGVGQVQALPETLANGIKGLVDWIYEIVDKIAKAFNIDNPAFKPAKDQLDNIKSSMDKIKDSVDSMADQMKPVTGALTGLAVPTAVVLLAGILLFIAAVARIRMWLPPCSIMFIALAAIPCGALAFVSGMFNIPFKVWCGEVDAWKAREPGLFKDYILPKFCEDKIDFKGLKDKLNSEANKLSQNTCNDLNNRCDASSSYSTLDDGKVFKCSTAVECSNVQGLVDAIGKLELKQGTPGMCAEPCTISKCATECTGDVKSTSSTIWNGANDANNALKAINDVIDNYLSCDIIMDKLLGAFDFCSTIHAGLNNIYAGAAIAITVVVLLPPSAFMGQKRFFKTSGQFTREGETGTAEMSLMNWHGNNAGNVQTDGNKIEL